MTSGDNSAVTYIKYHMKVSSAMKSRQFHFNFVSNFEHSLFAGYYFKISLNELTGTYFKYFTTRVLHDEDCLFVFATCQHRKASIAASSCTELTDRTTDVHEGIMTENPPKLTLTSQIYSQ